MEPNFERDRMEWPMTRLSLAGFAVLVVAWASSCSRNPRTAIVYGESADYRVTNGTAFDRAMIDAGDCRAVVVSSKTTVEFSEKPGKLTVLMEKHLGFFGHPPNSTSIDEMRTEMGCAYRKKDGKIEIGKFGEFDSGGEGGKGVTLTIRVPAGTVIERNDETELPKGDGAHTSPLKLHHEGEKSWCSRKGSDEHWIPLVGEPDREAFERRQLDDAGKTR
jgi:hypothetical protein